MAVQLATGHESDWGPTSSPTQLAKLWAVRKELGARNQIQEPTTVPDHDYGTLKQRDCVRMATPIS